MASFTTGNDAWDQGLGALSGSLFPDPSKIAQAGYYGAQQRKAGIEADIESQKWANQVTLGNYITGRYGNQQPTAGTASNGPAAPTPGLPPQLTSGTPPPMSPPSGSGAPPAPNTTTSDGKVPNNDTSAGRLHPATIMPGGGGQVAAAPAGANGSPAPISLDLGQLTGMSILANLPPASQQQAIQTLAVGLNNGGYVATPTGRQALADIMASQGNNALVQERSNLATTGMTTAAQRDVANIGAASAANVANIGQAGENRRFDMGTGPMVVGPDGPVQPTRGQFAAGPGAGAPVGPGTSPNPAPGPAPALGPSSITPPPPIGNVTIQPGNTSPPGVPTPGQGQAAPAAQGARAQWGVYNKEDYEPRLYQNPRTGAFANFTRAQWAARPDRDVWLERTETALTPTQVGSATPGAPNAIVPQATAAFGSGATGQAPAPGQTPGPGTAPGSGTPATEGSPLSASIVPTPNGPGTVPQGSFAAPQSDAVYQSWNTQVPFYNAQTGEVTNTTRAQLSQRPDQANWRPATDADLSTTKNYTDPTGHFHALTPQQFVQLVPPDKRAGWHITDQNETITQPNLNTRTGQPGYGSAASNAVNPNAAPLPQSTDQQTAIGQAGTTAVTAGENQSAAAATAAAGGTPPPLSGSVADAYRTGQTLSVAKPALTPVQQNEQQILMQNRVAQTYAPKTGWSSTGDTDTEATLPPPAMRMLEQRISDLQRKDPRRYGNDINLATDTALQSMSAEGYIPAPEAFNRGRRSGNFDKTVITDPKDHTTREAIALRFNAQGTPARPGQPGQLAPALTSSAQAAPAPASTPAPIGPVLSQIPVPAGWQPGRTGTTKEGVPFVVGPDGLPHAVSAAPAPTAPAPTPAPTSAPAPAATPPAPAPAPTSTAPTSTPAPAAAPQAAGQAAGLNPTNTPGLNIRITGTSRTTPDVGLPKNAPTGAVALAPEIRDGAHRNDRLNNNERQVAYGGFWYPEAIVQRVTGR